MHPGLVKTDFAMNRWNERERAEQFYASFKFCLRPEDVASAVLYALRQPSHVDVSQVVVVPVSQT